MGLLLILSQGFTRAQHRNERTALRFLFTINLPFEGWGGVLCRIMGPVNSYDFVERTQRLIEQYNRLNLSSEEYYNVTLLLNACVGLLFIAHEKHKNKLPNKTLQITTWGINPHQIKCCKIFDRHKQTLKNERVSLKIVCKHIRNSIAHCRFELKTNATKTIDRIHFEDWNNNNLTFDLTISLRDFRNFTHEVSQYILNLQSNQK